MPTTEDKFMQGNYFRFVLPPGIKAWPCCPAPHTTHVFSEIETNSLLVCQGTLQVFTETAVLFQRKDYEDYGKSYEFYISLEAAKKYCLFIRKHEQTRV